MNRRQLLLGGLTAFALSACQGTGGDPTTGPSSSSPPTGRTTSPVPSASTSASAFPDLTAPGAARSVIRSLTQQASLPVIKVDVTRDEARVSALDGKTVRAWRWLQGEISEVDSDIEHIEQASFDPEKFALDDVGALFEQAGVVAGSTSSQELQVVEQTPGSIMMVVTTRPESETVFFRPDGSIVNRLDFLTEAGLNEAVRDAVAGRTQLTTIALTRDALYAESPDPKDAGATLRVTRARKVPSFRTIRQEPVSRDAFSASDVPVAMLLEQMKTLPALWNQPEGSTVTWVIDRRDNRPLPTVRFTLGGRTKVTDLNGRDITHEV